MDTITELFRKNAPEATRFVIQGCACLQKLLHPHFQTAIMFLDGYEKWEVAAGSAGNCSFD
jgi:hypothetical protein